MDRSPNGCPSDQSDPAATILDRPTIRHDTRRQGELRCNAQLIEQVAGANEFSLREKRSRILQPPPRSFVSFIVERTLFSRKRDHADHTRGDRQSANKCPPFQDRTSTRLNSSHYCAYRLPFSA